MLYFYLINGFSPQKMVQYHQRTLFIQIRGQNTYVAYFLKERCRRMDINGLEYFIKAAETLNFTKAANECQITQTAMKERLYIVLAGLGLTIQTKLLPKC